MENYKEKIENCIEHLNSIRFPGNDWKEDKLYFYKLKKEFSEEPEDEKQSSFWKN